MGSEIHALIKVATDDGRHRNKTLAQINKMLERNLLVCVIAKQMSMLLHYLERLLDG